MAKILIIDDSVAVRDHLKRVLQKAGYEVHEAENAIQGMIKFNSLSESDLVIADYLMPGLDGLSMLQEIHRNNGGIKSRVMMLSAETSESLKSAARDVGVIAWMAKPINGEKLLSAISKILGSFTASKAA